MSSEFRKKILDAVNNTISTEDMLMLIDKAYKDEGYRRYESKQGYILLTGQQWMNRFFEELTWEQTPYKPLIDAARRAAGIDPPKETK